MKSLFYTETKKMLQKTEQSLKTTHKCYNSIGWRVLMWGFCVILLQVTVAAAYVEATTTGIATATTSGTTSLNPTNVLLSDAKRRSIRVGKNGSATILCKTSNRSSTYFVTGNEIIHPLDIENELLSNYALLVLNKVFAPSTYLCFQNGTLLSETILTIDNLIQTVVIEMGKGDDAALTCKHYEDQPIYFQKDLGKEDIRTDIVSIDTNTSILLIKNAPLQKSKYSCTYLDNKHIDESEVYVGTSPTPVINFNCENHNYISMFCEFTIPPNQLFPDYSLTYQVDSLISENCVLNEVFIKNGILTANTTLDHYKPIGYIYKFNLIANNVLGNLSQDFVVFNNESAIPPKLYIDMTDITSHSVSLNWWEFQSLYYQLELVYDIHVQPVDRDGYSNSSTCRTLECDMILDKLPYANWNYTLTVRARVNAANSKWNEPTILNFKTKPRIPDRPPKTIDSGFYIHYNSTEKVISLYWEELARHEQNGPEFYYSIDELHINGKLLSSKISKETSVTFAWLNEHRVYEVRAANKLGASSASSRIRVNVPQTLYAPQRIEQLINELIWMPPADYQKQPPSNYTVFWCQPKIMSRTKCEGSMHFETVDNSKMKFPVDEKEKVFIMAVAANYPNWSSGLHWKTCDGSIFDNLETVKLEDEAISSTEIAIKWSLSDTCVSAFNGYNVTYCQVENEGQQYCDSKNFDDPGIQNITLTGLQTYTKYRITMLLYAKDGRRGQPSEPRFCRTKDAAPDPPNGLRFENTSLTSNSVNISWFAPKITNGNIKKYTIWKMRENSTSDLTKTDIPVNEQNFTEFSYKLKDLSSYSRYKVWVTAWTSEESIKSESLNITTLMGRPSAPIDVDLNRTDDYYIVKWTDPIMLSGLVKLFELKFFNGDKVKVAYVQRGVKKTHRCRLKYPGCTGEAHKMEVRAINVVPEDQFDKTTFPIKPKTVQRLRRHSMPTISKSAVLHQSLTNGEKNNNVITPIASFLEENDGDCRIQQDFECELLDEDIKTQFPSTTGVRWLKSAPGLSHTLYNCEKFPYEILVASLIFVGMFIATIIWVGNDIRRRANCAVLLPDSINAILNKMPGSLTDSQSMNDSLSKSNGFGFSKYPIQSENNFDFGSALTPNSSASGVDGVGACDSVNSSSSRENIDDTYFDRCVPRDALVSSASNTSLNDTSLSSHQCSPLQRKNAKGAQTPTRNDVYTGNKQLTSIQLQVSDDGNASSDSSDLPLHSIAPKSPLNLASPVSGNRNVGNCIASANECVPTTYAAMAPGTAKPAIFNNYQAQSCYVTSDFFSPQSAMI